MRLSRRRLAPRASCLTAQAVLFAVLLASCTRSTQDVAEVPPDPRSSPSEVPTGFPQDARDAGNFYFDAHARPTFALDQLELQTGFTRLAERASGMTRSEFLVELMRTTARSGRIEGRDGHSGLYPLDTHDPELHLFPLQLFWFPEGLFVTQALNGNTDLVGAEVLAIGGQSIGKLVSSVEPLVPRDNEMSMRARLPQFLLTHEVLEGLGLVSGNPVEFTFKIEASTVRRSLEPIGAAEYGERTGLFHPMVPTFLPRADRPLYLAHRQRDFFLTSLEADDALYLQYNLALAGTTDIANRLTNLYRRTEPSKVIVDLRHNPGGDNFTYDALLDALSSGRLSQETDIYVLLGRGTFSAAGHFLVDLMDRVDVTLVGERSGFAPNQFGDPSSEMLEASGFKINAGSVEWIKTSRDDLRLWLEPDVPVTVDAADYFAGRDPVLEAALTR